MRKPIFYYGDTFSKYEEVLRKNGIIKSYAAGDFLNRVGENFSRCEYIITGKVSLCVLNPAGEAKTVCFFGSGCMFPPYSSPKYHYSFETNSLFVKALTDVTTISLSQENLLLLLKKDNDFCIDMLDFICDLTEVMLYEISSKSYTDNFTNVCTFLWVLTHDLNTNGIILSQNDIANAVGVSRVFVAQCLKKLRDKKIVNTAKMKITVLNSDKLAALCSPDIPV